jgi:hypothetical protein
MRQCEREEDFGPRFVGLARALARCRERRGALRRLIDEVLGTRPAEGEG